MTIAMYDSIDPATIPSNATAVAGYVGGWWPDYSNLVKRFPHAAHLSIAVHPDEDAECLDVESGDAVPGDAPAWVKRQIARGVHRPVVYTSVSEFPAVEATLSGAGIPHSDYRVWTAHYTYVAHIEPGSDATQWTDHAMGRNLDESLLNNDFFARPVPPVKNKPHYEFFEVGPFPSRWGNLSERKVVEQYDGASQHPVIYAPYRKFVLRPRLQFLANRVAAEAIQDKVNGRPSWGKFHRGYRFQQLIHRAQGQRFV